MAPCSGIAPVHRGLCGVCVCVCVHTVANIASKLNGAHCTIKTGCCGNGAHSTIHVYVMHVMRAYLQGLSEWEYQ